MKNWKRKVIAMVALAAMTTSLYGCQSKEEATETVVIGSKSFTENILVAELYALGLENAGISVDRQLELATSGVHTALTNGEIDMYPEYTGTGLTTWLGNEPVYDVDECYDIVKTQYLEQFGMVWLEPTGINNSETMTVTKAFSEETGITTISELWEQMDQYTLACNPEFFEQVGIYDRLQETYGTANFKEEIVMDHALCMIALLNGEVDVVDAYATEGVLASGDYLILEDDLHCWPPYYLAPVVSQEKLEAIPEVEAICNAISATLTTEVITGLNAKVDVDGEDTYDVAAEYFESIKDLMP